MPFFTVEYTVTEITRQRAIFEAENAEEARRMVEEYEFQDVDPTTWEVDSLKWEIDNVEIINEETDL